MMDKIRNSENYILLGIFRFFLAMCVVMQHGLHLVDLSDREIFYDIEAGVIAVTIFFSISGFIVSDALDSFYDSREGSFLLNRFLRLYPPYLFSIIIIFLAIYFLNDKSLLKLWDDDHLYFPLQYNLFISSLLDILPLFKPGFVNSQDIHILPFSWTLRIEFTFYVLAAFLFYLNRKTEKIGITKNNIVIKFAFVAAHAAAISFILTGGSRYPQIFGFIPFFIFGCASFNFTKKRSAVNMINLALSLAESVVSITLIRERGHPIHIVQSTVVCLLLIILWKLSTLTIYSSKIRAIDRIFGDLSYPIYLNHYAILLIISCLTVELGTKTYFLGIFLSIFAAILAYNLVEPPIKNLRNKIRGASL